MRNFYSIIIILIAAISSAQVGISANANYTVPAGVDLSIDGKGLTIRDRIYAGGTSTTLGNPGRTGQVLVSQGVNLPPRWRTLNIPDVTENLFYMIYNNSFTDYLTPTGTVNTTPGLVLGSTVSGNNGPYDIGITRTSLGTDFTSITGLDRQFEVFSNQNQVLITFETVAQISSTTAGNGVDFVCGVFVGRVGQNKTLRGIRKATLNQGNAQYPFLTFTMIALADGLTIGNYDVEVACKRTANYNSFTGNLGIGRGVSGSNPLNMNDFIAQTSLKVEVYEIPQVFNTILDLTSP